MQRTRLDWVDAGRGLAICLVVLFHSANWLGAAGIDTRGWISFNLVVSSLRMPLFFALSGLFAGKWLLVSWRTLWSGKVRMFAWVFLVWSTIGACAFTVGTRVMLDQGSLLKGTLLPIVLAPAYPRLELWFIWALALFFCLAKLTARLDPRLQLAVAGVGSAVALSGWVTASPGWNGSVRYYFFFLVGLHARTLIIRLGSTRRIGLLASGFAAWLVASFALWHWNLREVPGLYFINCLLGLVAGVALSRVVRWRAIRAVGSRTLPIYLAHTPIILLVCMVISLTAISQVPVTAQVAPPLLMLVAVIGALLLNRAAPRAGAAWLYEAPGWFPGRPEQGAPRPEPAQASS
nr:acyltransferase [Cellulomonas sp. JH27-2]